MYIAQLLLNDVRNIRHLDLTFESGGPVLFYGPNAAGKTSILEALFYLATTRSPRAGLDHELIRWDAPPQAGTPPFARLRAQVQRASEPLLLEVIVKRKESETDPAALPAHPPGSRTASTGTQKLIRINKKAVRSIDLVGRLRVVLFTPNDLVLVEGSPSERRRYLDITLSQLDPRYVRTLSRYNRLVQQRNSMLRAWREQRRPRRAVDTELDYWDHELSSTGGYILAERLRAMAELNTCVGPLFRDLIGDESPPLEMAYQPGVSLEGASSSDEMRQCLLEGLHVLRHDELRRGQTLVGPHRDDLLFTVGGVNLGVYGSRGQQRCVALALKLGEAALMHARSGDTPVLLLDDVLGELDVQRRAQVLQVINRPQQQTFLSATDLGDFDTAFLQQTQRLRVEAGQVFQA